MKIQKVLLAIRHTKKGGVSETNPSDQLSDSYIGTTGRACIQAIELPYDIKQQRIDLFGSGVCRTHQELTALILVNELDGEAHDPLLNMGNDTMFNAWMAAGLKDAVKETGSNIRGLEKVLGPEAFKQACEACADDIRKAISVMTYDYSLGVFHTPTIEMAAHALSMDYPATLAEDKGIVFVLYEDGSVSAYGTWSSGDPIPEVE
ncbi:MAG: hypothetical protein WCT27_05570 [Patescibacteria group bacterium]